VAYIGIWPGTGPDGELLDANRRAKSNKPMANKFATVEYRGDWKWHKEAFGLSRGYNSIAICHLCDASTKRTSGSQIFG